MAHTAGPWTVSEPEGMRRTVEPGIGQVFGLGIGPDANAHLIAAAPDLLAALKEMNELVDSLWDSIPWGQTFNLNIKLLNEAPIHAKQAIAKAEGARG